MDIKSKGRKKTVWKLRHAQIEQRIQYYSTLLPGRGCTGDGRRLSGADDVGERRHHDGELVLLVVVARRRHAGSLLPDDLRLSMVVTSLLRRRRRTRR